MQPAIVTEPVRAGALPPYSTGPSSDETDPGSKSAVTLLRLTGGRSNGSRAIRVMAGRNLKTAIC